MAGQPDECARYEVNGLIPLAFRLAMVTSAGWPTRKSYRGRYDAFLLDSHVLVTPPLDNQGSVGLAACFCLGGNACFRQGSAVGDLDLKRVDGPVTNPRLVVKMWSRG